MKPMADLPDIVVTSMEQTYPYVLVESLSTDTRWGVFHEVSAEDLGTRERSGPAGELRIWRFRDREALHVFAAARVRACRNEGISAREPIGSRLYGHCYDNITKTSDWAISRSEPLKW